MTSKAGQGVRGPKQVNSLAQNSGVLNRSTQTPDPGVQACSQSTCWASIPAHMQPAHCRQYMVSISLPYCPLKVLPGPHPGC
jgi:hypothetical protein